MSEETGGAPAAQESGFIGRVFGLWFAPEEQFPAIVNKPGFWAPVALMMARAR